MLGCCNFPANAAKHVEHAASGTPNNLQKSACLREVECSSEIRCALENARAEGVGKMQKRAKISRGVAVVVQKRGRLARTMALRAPKRSVI